jgi:hypothetical protein
MNFLAAQCDFNIDLEASSTILCPNDSVTLSVQDTFDSYQWYREGEALQGDTLSILEQSQFEAGGATYYVLVTHEGCTESSDSLLIDGYVFLPIYLVLTGSYGFDPNTEEFVLCDNTQFGGADTLILTVGLPYDTLFQWYRNGELIEDADGPELIVTEAGVYEVSAAPSICPNFVQYTLPTVTREGTPAVISIVQNGSQLEVESDQELSYIQWYFNGEEIQGANDSIYTPTENGIYNVYAENFVCMSYSADFEFITTSTRDLVHNQLFEISPNPFVQSVQISSLLDGRVDVELYSATGVLVNHQELIFSKGIQTVQFPELNSGVYFLRLTYEDKVAVYSMLRK